MNAKNENMNLFSTFFFHRHISILISSGIQFTILFFHFWMKEAKSNINSLRLWMKIIIIGDDYFDALRHEQKLINRIFSIVNSFLVDSIGFKRACPITQILRFVWHIEIAHTNSTKSKIRLRRIRNKTLKLLQLHRKASIFFQSFCDLVFAINWSFFFKKNLQLELKAWVIKIQQNHKVKPILRIFTEQP